MAVLLLYSFFKDEKGRWATWIVSKAAAAAFVVVVGADAQL